MGYTVHEAVLVTYPHTDAMEAVSHKIIGFVEDLTPFEGSLFMGPVVGKDIVSWVMMPDGAPEGTRRSDEADEVREAFLNLVIPVEGVSIVHLNYGGTQKETVIVFSTDDIEEGDEYELELEADPNEVEEE